MLELPEKRKRPEPFRFRLSGIREGDTPYNGIEGEAPPVHFERGTFFKPKVYERVGKSVFPLVKNPAKADGRFSGKVKRKFLGFVVF